MADRCPHCGFELPPVRDAYCPGCREELRAPRVAPAARPFVVPTGWDERAPVSGGPPPAAAAPEEAIALGGIVFTPDRVFEGTPSRPSGAIARAMGQRIRLRYGAPV